jgi:hypothetical protein
MSLARPSRRSVSTPARRSLVLAISACLLATAGAVGAASIHLNAGALDTALQATPSARAPVGNFDGRRLHLVQFPGPIQNAWVDAIKADGLRVVNYLPDYAYLVYGDAASLARMQARATAGGSAIQWDGAWLDEYKLAPSVWTDEAQRALPLPARSVAGDRFMLQLVADAAANAATLATLEGLGGTILAKTGALDGFQNFDIQLPGAALAQFAARPDIVSVHRLQARELLDERQNMIVAGNLTGNVPNPGNYFNLLAAWGFTPAQFSNSGFVVDVTDDGADINPGGTLPPANTVTGPVAANHFVLYAGGQRPIGAATPTGTSRFAYKGVFGSAGPDAGLGNSGHGQLNMSIVGGFVPTGSLQAINFAAFPHADAAGYRFGFGVAPYVRLANSVIFDPNFRSPNFVTMLSANYGAGARVSSNSWGAPAGGAYNADSQTYDGLVRDAQAGTAGQQPMVILFAAGNSGPNPNTTGSPGTGKNMITVGAAENVHPFGGADGCGTADAGADSANDIIGFSSRGPTDDGRAKPEIVAPGTHVTGMAFVTPTSGGNGTRVATYRADGVCAGVPPSDYFPVGQAWYTASSGTSHSTPALAGGAALVFQQFINNPPYLGAQRVPAGSAPPSPALVKAYLINSARYMNGVSANDTLPSNSQGMGMMNLGTAFDGTPRAIRDQAAADTFTASAQTRTFNGTVADPTKPFRVTLAWTDAPGATAGNAYVNNLDLSVTVGGNTYLGNAFTGANSSTGGTADVRNNAESVFLPAGATGPYTVTVIGTNIAGVGNPGVAGNNQDFALVVYNSGTPSTCPAIAVTPGSLPGGQVGSAYSQSFAASGGTGPYTWAVTGGVLPTGLSLSGSGTLSGTLGAGSEGTASFAVTATDANGCSGRVVVNPVIACPAIAVTPTTMPASVLAGTAFPPQSLGASGGAGPYTFTVGGTLPPGLSVVGGTLSGTPTAGGTFNFSVVANDTLACAGARAYTVEVLNAVVARGATTVTSGNAILEPNECNTLGVVLNNTGNNPATAVNAVLSSTTPGVTVDTAASSYPDLAATNGSAGNTVPFQLSTDGSVACGSVVNLRQVVTFAGGISPTTLDFAIPVGQQGGAYVFGAPATTPIDPAAKTLIAGSTGDDVLATVATPFAFSVYGTQIAAATDVRVSSNGNIQFVPTGGSTAFSNTALPAGAFGATVPVVMAYWDDLLTNSAGGGIYQSVTGTAPNRVWNLEWRGTLFAAGAAPVNFELRFFENQSRFQVVYNNAAGASGASATVGVQAANTGTTFTQYLFNTAGTVFQGQGMLVSLPPPVCSPGPGTCAAGANIFTHGFESPAP